MYRRLGFLVSYGRDGFGEGCFTQTGVGAMCLTNHVLTQPSDKIKKHKKKDPCASLRPTSN